MNHPKVTRVIVHGLVSAREACKMVACDPAVAFFQQVENHYADPYRDEIIHHIREINKRMFKLGIYMSVPPVVATSVWDYGCRHHLKWPQNKVAATYNVSTVVMRNLHQKLYPRDTHGHWT